MANDLKIIAKKSSKKKCGKTYTLTRRKPPQASEEQITESICKYLSLFGGAQINRIAPSGFFKKNSFSKSGVMIKHKSKFVQRGVADILFWYKKKFIALEVKVPKEYNYICKNYLRISKSIPDMLSKKDFHILEQIEYLEGIRRNGFVGEFVCSLEQVRKILERK